jgi:hypothetical protein
MTDTPPSAAPTSATPRSPVRSPVRRWLTGDVDLAFARTRRLTLDETQASLLRRAKEARVVADYLIDPLFVVPYGDHRWSAISLYRESACLALAVLDPSQRGGQTPLIAEPPWAAPLAVEEFPLDGALVEAARRALSERDFYATSELPKPALKRELRAARTFVHRLLETIDLRQRSPLQVLLVQAQRWLALALAVAALVAIPLVARKLRTPPSTIVGWRTSSAYTGFAAEGKRPSPQFQSLWFHTVEEFSPWVEVDLGFAQQVTAVHLKNRSDCCGDRALPLLVEVSTDRVGFHEVARQDAPFDRVTVGFAPVTARYVRLRVPRRTLLHLEDMSVDTVNTAGAPTKK